MHVKVGRSDGLEFTMVPSAAAGSAVLWGLLSLGARRYAGLSPLAAAGTGLAGMLLHWTSDTIHNLGHAWVARRTGYPMSGIRYAHVLVSSVYPPDEPPLLAALHVRRALGGPPVSLTLGLLGLLLALALNRRPRSAAGFLAWLFCLENVFVFGLGAFVPLGFTDGSTLLRWVPQLRTAHP